jgi:hypothetical protein
MTPQEAHKLLDRVREGRPVPLYLIELALVATGDKPAELGHE